MKPIEIELIKTIVKEKKITSKMLATRLDVSPRSVINYVQQINSQIPNTILSSNDGYEVCHENVKKILEDQSTSLPQTSKERITYIANRLLSFDLHKSINCYDLCDELYISLSSLKKDLKKVKKKAETFDLTLEIKGNEIKLVGSEKNKRKMISTIIYDESTINFVNLTSIQKNFPNIDISFIKAVVLDTFEKEALFINDYSLMNLILHITIAIDRIMHNDINTIDFDNFNIHDPYEFQIAQRIANQFEEKFHIQYTQAEVYDMSLLILSRATSVDYQKINQDNLITFIGEQCMNTVNKIMKHIHELYGIDLNEPEFIVRFALHTKNLIIRSRNNYYSKNPLAQSIKTSCPLIYDIAIYAARTLETDMNIHINEDEIAYIAFHFGNTFEQQKSLNSKVTAILYCPNYYDMSVKLTNRINAKFSNELLITALITDESDLSLQPSADIILTTIPLSIISSHPIVEITFYFSSMDEKKISDMITDVKFTKKKHQFETYLRQLITSELFEIRSDYVSQELLIPYMVQKLYALDYVDENFESQILEREQLSTTAFGNFAIPHTLKMNAKKTGLNIIISKKPIDWNQHPVQLIIMMCFNKNDRHLFNETYEPLTMILNESKNVDVILQCSSYEEFITSLVNMLD